MEYYSVTRRNAVLLHTAVCMNLKSLMLSERSHTQNIVWLHFDEISQINKSMEMEANCWSPGARGDEDSLQGFRDFLLR